MTPPRKPPRRRGRGEAGETLVETLLTVTIMSIAFAAILFAIGTAIRFSGTHRDQANADVALGAAAEAVKAAPPQGCPNPSYASVLSGLSDLPARWSAANLSIVSAVCDTLGLQTITIKATAPGGTASETVSVLKRST
jgi:type II secretory pathway pseudopilin PulG